MQRGLRRRRILAIEKSSDDFRVPRAARRLTKCLQRADELLPPLIGHDRRNDIRRDVHPREVLFQTGKDRLERTRLAFPELCTGETQALDVPRFILQHRHDFEQVEKRAIHPRCARRIVRNAVSDRLDERQRAREDLSIVRRAAMARRCG